jgi:hypothetical protein
LLSRVQAIRSFDAAAARLTLAAPDGFRIDRNRKEVAADLAGLVTCRSVFLGAEGCRVANQGAASARMHDDPPTAPKPVAMLLPVGPVNPALESGTRPRVRRAREQPASLEEVGGDPA